MLYTHGALWSYHFSHCSSIFIPVLLKKKLGTEKEETTWWFLPTSGTKPRIEMTVHALGLMVSFVMSTEQAHFSYPFEQGYFWALQITETEMSTRKIGSEKLESSQAPQSTQDKVPLNQLTGASGSGAWWLLQAHLFLGLHPLHSFSLSRWLTVPWLHCVFSTSILIFSNIFSCFKCPFLSYQVNS